MKLERASLLLAVLLHGSTAQQLQQHDDRGLASPKKLRKKQKQEEFVPWQGDPQAKPDPWEKGSSSSKRCRSVEPTVSKKTTYEYAYDMPSLFVVTYRK